MAYRKTEKVLAQLEAKKSSVIASAIDVIAKHGMEGLTTDAVAKRAGVAVGLLYHYFPDKTEILAAVVQQLLERDVAAMREGVKAGSTPVDRLAVGISILASRVASNYRLMLAIGQVEGYRIGIRSELAKLIKATEPSEPATILAQIVLGAILEAAQSLPRFDKTLTTSLLMACGVAPAKIRETVF